MTAIPQKGVFDLGPYLGYRGRAEYDADAGLWHGEVLGLRDVVTFQGKTIEELAGAFLKSVEDYYDFCKSRGEEPERPFSGRFVIRISPEIHERISTIASSSGVSLNQLVASHLESLAEKGFQHGMPDFIAPGLVVQAKGRGTRLATGADTRVNTRVTTGRGRRVKRQERKAM